MLSYRVGSVETGAGARDLAAYYATEQTMAAYYGKIGEVREGLSERMAERLGIDVTRTMLPAEMAELMRGRRTDGSEIEGRTERSQNQTDGKRARTAVVDFTFSAGKSVSVAVALANTPEERQALIGAHQRAVAVGMRHLESEIGYARRGRGGRLGSEAAEMAWVTYDHFTSRPAETGAAPDPQTHTHAIAMTSILTPSGHLGSLDLNKLQGRIHETGRVYQAALARELRTLGANVEQGRHGEATLPAIPERVVRAFSSRNVRSDVRAKEMAAEQGQAWNALPEAERIELRRRAMMASRNPKQDGEPSEAIWREKAERLGYRHEHVLGHHLRPELDVYQRREAAYAAAVPLLADAFTHSATLPVAKLREIAAAGLLTAGIGNDPGADIAATITRVQDRGIELQGQTTKVLIHQGSATTELTYGQEREAQSLAKVAYDAGGLSVEVGAAGSGKSYRTEKAAALWRAEGRTVYGAALAWRTTGAFQSAGIDKDHRAALAPALARIRSGQWNIGAGDVLVIDEVAVVGTRQLRDVLRLQAERGFALHLTGDDKQTRSIEHGAPLTLLRNAGIDMPEFTQNYRQRSERDQQTAALWRDGKAMQALDRLHEDKSLHFTPGRDEAIAKAAELWEPGTLFIAPTNQDARDVGLAIRQRRQEVGEVARDAVVVKAQDYAGTFDLPLAVGDRVRLFDRVHDAAATEKRTVIASNGDIVRVLAVKQTGMLIENERDGARGTVRFDRISDGSAIRIGTGEASTVNIAQGVNVDRAVFVMASGSRSVDGFKAYTAASRHHDRIDVVLNETADRDAIAATRMGRSTITRDDVVAYAAKNLGRQTETELASNLMERVAIRRTEIERSNETPDHELTQRLQIGRSLGRGR